MELVVITLESEPLELCAIIVEALLHTNAASLVYPANRILIVWKHAIPFQLPKQRHGSQWVFYRSILRVSCIWESVDLC